MISRKHRGFFIAPKVAATQTLPYSWLSCSAYKEIGPDGGSKDNGQWMHLSLRHACRGVPWQSPSFI